MFFDQPTVRATSYSYEIELLLAKNDKKNAKEVFNAWSAESTSKQATPLSDEQRATYQTAFGA